ncbi:unnamed protein product [Symbiodinium natans]|uniref:Cyclic nucleotide-binding domain-containing protein n=1 Tax=Symbiodinium natans TaxID=878477 RepID=A0A812IB09_9DINO|nr:unnamed protein product [Symbiodinium natans]
MERTLRHPTILVEDLGETFGSFGRRVSSGSRRTSGLSIDTPHEGPFEIGNLEVARQLLTQIRLDLQLGAPVPESTMSEASVLASTADSLGAESQASGKKEEQAALGAAELFEVQRILVARGSDGYTLQQASRLAHHVKTMHFFRRLSEDQLLELLMHAEFLDVELGAMIYKDGDPVGYVYVVLNGSVTIERALEGSDGVRVFAKSIFDGRAFGDGWDGGNHRGSSTVRWTTAVAQERSLVLRFSTPQYMEVLQKDDVCSENASRLRSLNFLSECSASELEMLLMTLETGSANYACTVLRRGERPHRCRILTEGRLNLLTSAKLEVRELVPGSSFGIGAILSGRGSCSYTSEVEVSVTSMVAHFYLMSRKSLSPLPDMVQESILQSVRQTIADCQDPIQDDGRLVIRRDRDWRRRKQRSLAEVRRTCGRSAARAGEMRPRSAVAGQRWCPAGPGRPFAESVTSLATSAATTGKGPHAGLQRTKSVPGRLSIASAPPTPSSFGRTQTPMMRSTTPSSFMRTTTPSMLSKTLYSPDGRPLAIFRRTEEGFELLPNPAPLNPVDRRHRPERAPAASLTMKLS